ncbi:MAG: ubiquinol-cytochrome C chaperone [Alphaproteobacteria bacterium]|nr:ubiquinol-cytochrome C chaperone [Alphaproteobacteria bacterium]
MLNLFRKSAARKALGLRLYGELISRARALVFFREFEVADTIDGRFDLVALHGWLALEHLEGEAAQALIDAIFIGFDEAMREQGQGDMGLGRKMKQFADAWYGRLAAYSAAKDTPALAAALARNLYRGARPDDRAMTLAEYAIAAREYLRYAPDGVLDFGPLPVRGLL